MRRKGGQQKSPELIKQNGRRQYGAAPQGKFHINQKGFCRPHDIQCPCRRSHKGDDVIDMPGTDGHADDDGDGTFNQAAAQFAQMIDKGHDF